MRLLLDAGLILTGNRRFPRHDTRTAGRLVTALDELLARGLDVTNAEHWLCAPTPNREQELCPAQSCG